MTSTRAWHPIPLDQRCPDCATPMRKVGANAWGDIMECPRCAA